MTKVKLSQEHPPVVDGAGIQNTYVTGSPCRGLARYYDATDAYSIDYMRCSYPRYPYLSWAVSQKELPAGAVLDSEFDVMPKLA
ncbi:hypothetical protein PG990_013841 [Apiospora arundinis]|jgi:hypothetical protein|uniref:Uncharacterized protein n=1 Tax=Apiospora arundinis TaxID=335852 RepID=A0ABR2I9X1_9PEZI